MSGRCKAHSDAGLAEDDAKKRAFLEAYRERPHMDYAASVADSSRTGIWRLRQSDPEFDAQVAELVDGGDDRRYAMVEDSLFLSCLEGTHKGGERMFFLVNASRRRGDGRWRNTSHVETSNLDVDLSTLSEAELQELAAGVDLMTIIARRAAPEVEGGDP